MRITLILLKVPKTLQIVYFIYECFTKYLDVLIIKPKGYIYMYINKKDLLKTLIKLNNNCFIYCKQLLDIVVVDYIGILKEKRFKITYVLLSQKNKIRIFLVTFLKQYDNLLSIVWLFKSADWLEREIWDMFGIFFKGHKNLKRILTDYGFKGHPLRKDFPLNGFCEIRYDYKLKSILIEPIEFSQEYRFLKTDNPWNVL